MAPPLTEVADIQLQLTTCETRKDERLSWPGWLTYSGRFTHASGHPSATDRAQDREVRRPKTYVLPLCHAGGRAGGKGKEENPGDAIEDTKKL